jgi:hypothetical protein
MLNAEKRRALVFRSPFSIQNSQFSIHFAFLIKLCYISGAACGRKSFSQVKASFRPAGRRVSAVAASSDAPLFAPEHRAG